MGNLQDFSNALTNWSFGIVILFGLIASEFLGSEVIIAIFISGFTSFLTGICGFASLSPEEQYRRKKPSNILYFLITWFDILTHLVAAASCARFASATIDYISRGHFREILFGLESHSLGEPWPDVLGVTIIVVVAILFMLGLEQSPIITALLFLTLMAAFLFFVCVGSFYTIIDLLKWCENFKLHSMKTIIRATALSSFAFFKDISKFQRSNGLKSSLMFFIPLVFYLIITLVFSLMTHRRELAGTALPLIQVFEHRDVDWARPIMSVFTISIVSLVLTEVLPAAYNLFVKLASKDWQIFFSSMQYRSSLTGAPVLAIFAAGSLAAILAFACPLSHLIKLLNSSCIIKCVLNASQLLYNRYKPEIRQNEYLVYHTNIHYSKLKQNGTKATNPAISKKFKSIFGARASYIAMNTNKGVTLKNKNRGERECLLLDDYNTKSIILSDDSGSENEEIDIDARSDISSSSSSTDIDLVVQEYKEGLQVTTIGKFNKKRPATTTTALVVATNFIIILMMTVCISLYILKIVHIYWPCIIGILISSIVIIFMPENSEDKTKTVGLLPSFLYPICLLFIIIFNIILLSTILHTIWEGIIFWIIAGLLLFWRCDCCTCDGLFSTINRTNKVNTTDIIYEYRDNNADTIYITR